MCSDLFPSLHKFASYLRWANLEQIPFFRPVLTAEANRVLRQLVMYLTMFNCLFPLDVQNEMQLLSRVFCYSKLVCLLVFWLRNASLVKVGNPISDGIVFVFHVAWYVRGLKSLKRFWSYLIYSFQELHLNWNAWVIIVFDVCCFISNFMKSITVMRQVYARL